MMSYVKLRHAWPPRVLRRFTSQKGYYVLLPELPADTPETNPLLRVDGLPKFSKITPDNVVSGCSKLCLECDCEVGKITDRIKAGDTNFGTIFGAIEAHLAPLSCALRLADHLKNVDARFHAPFWRIAPQCLQSKSSRWHSEILYKGVVKNLATNQHLTSLEKRLCQVYVSQSKQSGIDLPEKKSRVLRATVDKLEKEQAAFRACVVKSQSLFEHVIDDASLFGDAPKSLLYRLALNPADPLRGPWRLTIQPDVFHDLQQFCESPEVRWNIWQAWANRASNVHSSNNLSNNKRINDIRIYARDRAKLLGFPNAPTLDLQISSMAGSVGIVQKALEKAKDKIKPVAIQEVESLKTFSATTKDIMPWDMPYWRQKWHQHLFGKHLPIQRILSLDTALNGIFDLVDNVFGVRFQRLPSHAANTWHPSVIVYQAISTSQSETAGTNGGQPLGYLYLDLFSRPGDGKCAGNWCALGRESSALLNCSPLSFVVMNLDQPLPKQAALLSVTDVAELARLIGSSLPQLLCQNQFSEISAGLQVELDFGTVVGNLLRFLVTDNAASLQQISGSQLNESEVASLQGSLYHMGALDALYQFYVSAFDLDNHMDIDTDWTDVMKRNWQRYLDGVIPLVDKEDRHPCGLPQLFSAPHFGLYYSLKWSELVARDLFSAFDQTSSAKWRETGLRIRRAIIEPGCLLTATDAFRRARGRDFDVDNALNQFVGIVKRSQAPKS